MRTRLLAWVGLSTGVGLSVLIACSSPDVTTAPPTTPKEDATVTSKSDSGSSGGNEAAPPNDAGPSSGRVYAHTQDTLYLFEPLTKKLTWIGKFDCLDAGERVLDIAVDRTGSMYATADSHFLSVDPVTAKCKVVAAGTNYPNSLSFVPQGTVDPAKEVLVGYAFEDIIQDGRGSVADEYSVIDTNTGAMSDLASGASFLDPDNNAWQASGDLISLINAGNKTYVTIKPQVPEAGAPMTDYLAEVDPATGALKTIIGPTNQQFIYGLGYWAGKAYGFSDDGRITEINVASGASTVIDTLKDDAGAAVPWFGAGVTTQAPVSP